MHRQLILGLIVVTAALGQTTWPQLRLVRVTTGLNQPVDIQSARDGSGRLFVVEQNGVIRLLKRGVLQASPFLDIRGKVACCGETGLLGLAFPNGYGSKQFFYVNYTERAPNLRTVIARYRVRGINPDAADPGSEERLLVFDQPFDNHNGGQLAIGPKDGLLYIGTGDGGSAGDPLNNGQNASSPLGKILRMDADNGGQASMWAYGLRNPWRFAFDRETNDLWIADVGQNTREEVDFQPASSPGGVNYGWRIMEGSLCYNPSSGCNMAGLTLPIFEYGHDVGISITGGYIYRGSVFPAWRGVYFLGDYGSGRVWGIQQTGAQFVSQQLLNLGTGFNITTFGQDENGEIYVARYSPGEIYHLVDQTPHLKPEWVVNAASFVPGVVPGSLVSVFGAGVSGDPGTQQAPSTPLPKELSGSAVYFNDIQAPVYAVANVGGQEQINVQVPWEVAGMVRVSVSVARGSNRSAAVQLDVSQAQPGIFAAATTGPVTAGAAVEVYATGLGAVDNPPPSGNATPDAPLVHVRDTVEATVGGRTAQVLFSGLAPRFVGLYQVNIVVPDGLTAGDQDLVLRVGGVASPPIKLAVR